MIGGSALTVCLWILQDYMREFAICIATGGPGLKDDLSSDAGRRLLQLTAELARLCTTQAAADFQAYLQFMTKSVLPVEQQNTGCHGDSIIKQPNWLKLAVSVHDLARHMSCTHKHSVLKRHHRIAFMSGQCFALHVRSLGST